MQVRSAGSAARLPFSPERIFRRYLAKRFDLFDCGSLRLELPNGAMIQHAGLRAGPVAEIKVVRWRLIWKLLAEGEIGLARGYVDGDWSTPDLSAVLEFGLYNQASITPATRGVGAAHLVNRLMHRLNANTRGGSRRNIAAHYDLGNRFYELWLDREMTYSSAIYETAHETLDVAQARKIERVIELLSLQEASSVLEIGCGWGGLARRIAAAGGGPVTGISLSREQIDYARAGIAGGRHETAISFELADYRSVAGRYDRIVSIEMFEAVGERYWPVFFDQLRRSLNDGGSAVMQIITIADDVFESYRSRPDFIQQYIFPGGMLPTVAMVERHAKQAGLRVVHYEPFGLSYARTLDAWRERFNAAWPEIERLGFDDRFRRMWTYYLTYCAVGFRHNSIDVGLFQLRADQVATQQQLAV